MQLKEEAVFTLKFDGKPVVNQLGELEQRLKDVKEAQKTVEKGTKEWADNKAEIKQLEASIRQVREEMGVSGMTVKQLEGYYRQLNREIADLTPGTEAYKRKASDLQEVNTALSGHRQNIRAVSTEVEESQSTWSRLKGWMSSAFTIGAIIEGGRQLYQFFTDAVQNFREFDKAAQQLSAITGATGADLDYLKQQAKEVGPTFGKTGAEMLEAYQLMASAKPELLEQKELLTETTKAALTLAQAGSIDLAEATRVTAESLNQFGEGAGQANRYINVIAAGAKEGAAEIAEMGGSLKASGTVAKAAGLSFEQTNAVLQSMSTIALKGEQAGTGLRNVLLKLQSGAADTNPEIVGLDKALENLGKKNLSAAEMAKLFGTENVVAAQHIVSHRKEIGELTQKLTGTQEAFSQAAKNQESLDFQMQRSKATYAVISTELGEKLSPIVVKLMGGFLDLMDGFGETVKGAGPLISVISTLFSTAGTLAGQIFTLVKTVLGIKDGADGANQVLKVLTGIFGLVAAAAGGVVTVIGMVVDGLRILSGDGSWDDLKRNATANFENIKQGLRSAFVEEPKKLQGETSAANRELGSAGGKAQAEALRAEINKVLPELNKDYRSSMAARLKNATEDQLLQIRQEVSQEKAKEDDIKRQKLQTEADARKQKADEDKRARDQDRVERIKHEADLQKAIADMSVAAIADDEQRKIAQLGLAATRRINEVMATKASEETKATLIQQINDQLQRDIATAQKEHRTKHEKEEAETAKRVLDLKVKLSGDEKADKLQKLEDVAAAQRLQIQKDVTDETQKADLLKQINTNLVRDKEQVNNEFRRKETEANNTLRKQEQAAVLAQFNAQEQAAGNNAQELLAIKKKRLDKEYEFYRINLRAERDEELRRIEESNLSQQQKAQAQQAINDKYQADVKASLLKHTSEIDAIDKESTEQKKQRQQSFYDTSKQTISEFFSAVKGLMTGDFQSFMSFLTEKLFNSKKANEEEAQDWKQKALQRVEQAAAMVQGLQMLNQTYLNNQLERIDREKNARIQAVQEQISTVQSQEDAYEARKAQLEQQLRMARTEAERQELREKLDNLEQERLGREEYFRQIDAKARQYHADMADLEAKMLQARTDAEKKELQDKIDNLKKEQLANQEKLDKVADAEKKYEQDKKALEDKLRNARTDAEKKELQQKLVNLEIERKGTVASKQDLEAQIDKINKEADAKIKEQQLAAFRRQQALDIAQAVINGAQAALKSLATMGWPLGLIGVAGAAVATGIQIALIKRQQPPQMRSGGMIRNAGVPEGPRHGGRYGDSGLSITRRDTGEEVAEMEGGEPVMVLSRKTYSNNRRVVDALMHSSLHRGGAPIYKAGGIMGSDGGSYSDYLGGNKKPRFDDGGWMVMDDGGSGGYSEGTPDNGSPETAGALSDAQAVANVTNDQIEKSQAQMDDIVKNTGDTILAVDAIGDYLAGEFTSMVKDQANQQMTAQDVAFTALINQTKDSNQALITSVETNLTNLSNTMKQQGQELIDALQSNMNNLATTVKQQGSEQLAAIQNQTSTLDGAIQGQTGNLMGELRNQSGTLGVIASKDLSVQTFVNVVNQIDVVANKSDFQ